MSQRRLESRVPIRFVQNAGGCAPGWRHLWRELRSIVVPTSGNRLLDLAHGHHSQAISWASGGGPTCERHGAAVRLGIGSGKIDMNNGLTARYVPSQAPVSAFAFLYPRDLTTNQALCGVGSGGGWTFRLVQGSGQLGFTRWGIADEPSAAMLPTANADNALGFSHDGTTLRYFLNGKFENKASGNPSSVGNAFFVAGDDFTNTYDSSLYVLYCWARTLRDEEFLQLMQDPWGPIRPRVRRTYAGVGGGGGSGARSFVAGFIG